MANFCPRCGGATGPNDAFCGACGTPLTGGEYGYNESANPYDAGAPVAENGYWVAEGGATVGPSFWGSFAHCMKNYCNFRGRATRTEYWGWIVVNALIGGALQIVAAAATLGAGANVYSAEATTEVVKGLWNLAVMLPAFAVMGRRLHDVGWSAKQILGPIALGIVGLTLLIIGIGPENLDSGDDVASTGTMFVGLASIVPAAIWQLVLGIASGFVRGTDGPNRFGGKRLNPADVGR
ncbi:MAG: zinc-ribbon domain-containing protein [Thermoguttaceae bacterium]|nr:zinc-ribbon domain-containing protein [Thermoguttaceae bacterium]